MTVISYDKRLQNGFTLHAVDLFDIVQSRFERDRDRGQGLDWFSRSGLDCVVIGNHVEILPAVPIVVFN